MNLIVKKILLTAFVCQFAVYAYGQTWEIGYPNAADVIATLEDGTLTIAGTGAMLDFVGTSYFSYSGITKVIITNGVTTIGAYAFDSCFGLTDVTIPNSIITIGECAFQIHGDNLKNITIPNSVTKIGPNAFRSCYGLTEITIPNSVTTIENSTFASCWSLEKAIISHSVTIIGNWAFNDCWSLTDITIPNSVTIIGNNAFYRCSSLTGISIPHSVEIIGNSAFSGCGSLIDLTIPNSVTTIGVAAFSNCRNLVEVTIPKSVTSIGTNPFYLCSSLTAINVDADNTAYSSENGVLFDKKKTLLIQYPNAKQGECTIPGSVTAIGIGAFESSHGLTEVTIPNSISIIRDFTFRDCISLTEATIPNSVTIIGSYAFSGCISLAEVTIPNSVNIIGNFAFSYCTSLNEVTCLASVPPLLGGSAFSDETIILYVPIEGKGQYEAASSWKNFEIILELGSDDVFIVDGIRYLKINDTNVEVIRLNYSGVVVIPAQITWNGVNYDVTSIKNDTFKGFNDLMEVIIPHLVTTIGEGAFAGCRNLASIRCLAGAPPSLEGHVFESTTILLYVPKEGKMQYELANGWKNFEIILELDSDDVFVVDGIRYLKINETNVEVIRSNYSGVVVIPDQVTWNSVAYDVISIRNTAFYDINDLTSITIPGSVTTIVDYAFENCTNLQEVIIPNSVTTIGAHAFHYCISLQEVIIPNSVTTIGARAFTLCYSLSEVTIPNSVETINENAFFYCTALTDVWVDWTIPLSFEIRFEDAIFFGVNLENVNLHVPAGTQCAYAAALIWQDFHIVDTQEKQTQEIDFPEIPTKTCGDEPITLPPTTDAGLPINYQSSNTAVATVTGNILTIMGAGTTEITATQSGDCAYTAATPVIRTLTVNLPASAGINVLPFPQLQIYPNPAQRVSTPVIRTLTVSLPTPTDIDDHSLPQLQIYPNPAHSDITIELGELNIKMVEIYDLSGRKMFHSQWTAPTSSFNSPLKINVSGLPKGVYAIRVHSDKGLVISKFIKE